MHKIYYFSGTGNTLAAAEKIAALLGDTKLISIARLQRSEDVDFRNAESVGIFCPVYCSGIPNIVQKFTERIVVPEDDQPYVYSLCTSGGMLGSAHLIMEQCLAQRRIRLNAYYHVPMPSNYIPLSKRPTPHHQETILKKADELLEKIARQIREKKLRKPFHLFPLDLFREIIGRRAVSYMQDYDKYFWLTEDCNSCGLCEKLCPASNIIIMNGMPTWRGHCEQCMTCLQWCPKQAIQFKQITLKRERYHHPGIGVDKLMQGDPEK